VLKSTPQVEPQRQEIGFHWNSILFVILDVYDDILNLLIKLAFLAAEIGAAEQGDVTACVTAP